jgi:WD40 repeat protein
MMQDRIATCIAFNPHGTHLAIGGHDSTVKLWDLFTNKEVSIVKVMARLQQ